MKQIFLVITLFVFTLLSGCSSTPGDAALRSGYPDIAAEQYQTLAEGGDATAALKLGMLIEAGRVDHNKYGNAADWYDKACQLGSLPGCHNVAVSYENGQNGYSRNIEEAKSYYEMAATRGLMQSQYNLGSLYANKYIDNDAEGYMWMLLAEQQAKGCQDKEGCRWILEDPPRHRNELKSRLSTSQLEEAELRAKNWKPVQ